VFKVKTNEMSMGLFEIWNVLSLVLWQFSHVVISTMLLHSRMWT